MSVILAAPFAAGLLLIIAGAEKVSAPSGSYGGTPRLLGLGEALTGIAVGVGLTWSIVVQSEVAAAVVTASAAAIYGLLAVGAGIKGRLRTGTNCGCSARLETPLRGTWSVVTARSSVVAVACAFATAIVLAQSATPDGLPLAVGSGATYAVIAWVYPYVWTSQMRLARSLEPA